MEVMAVAELGKRPRRQRASLAPERRQEPENGRRFRQPELAHVRGEPRLPPQGSAFVAGRLRVKEQEYELECVR